MNALRVGWVRLRAFLNARGSGRIDQEIAEHLACLAADLERRGMTPEAARLEARRQFGGAAQIAETWRERRSLPPLETALSDVRYALRQLAASPGFAAAALLTLALGIGANTTIFRVLDAVVLESLPVRHPEDLIVLQGYHNGHTMSFSQPLFREMARRQQSVEGLFAAVDLPVRNAELKARLASGGYFRLLGVPARLGRVFTEDDERPDAPPVAVISDDYWHRAFSASVAALGQKIQINDVMATVIGVAPPEFFGERVGTAPDIWMPMSLGRLAWTKMFDSPAMAVLSPMARLRPGIAQDTAQAALNGLYGQLTDLSARSLDTTEFRLELKPGNQGVRDLQERFSSPLRVLMGIVGLVMLIACCNLANLLLARAAARGHEMGVRMALGASRGRLLRQLLTESLVLAGLGSILGFAVAVWGARQLVALASAGQSWRLAMDMSWRVAAFTAAISVVAACLFGLAPALAATRPPSSRTHTGGSHKLRMAGLFVVTQVAVSLLLLATASLLVRSFWNLEHQDFGYRQEGALMVQLRIDLTAMKVNRETDSRPIEDRLNAIPGVRAAALVGLGPLGTIQSGARIAVPERPSQAADEARMVAVSGRYFEAMGIPILAGRAITPEDRAGTEPVAVISETAARGVFGTASPIGRYFTDGPSFDGQHAVRIVGVARDIRYNNPREPFSMLVYLPLDQHRAPLTAAAIRTAGDPALLAPAARQALAETAPQLKIAAIRPIAEIIGSQLTQERMMALLSGAFGLLALVLAAVGLYGVIAYGVERRTREIGIRLALGATRAGVSRMLVRDALSVLVIGLAVGAAATTSLGRLVRSLLFGLTPHDPAMLSVAAVLLSAVAAAAAYLPARRAARLDPVNALRQE